MKDNNLGNLVGSTILSFAPSISGERLRALEKVVRSAVLFVCMAVLLLTCLRILGLGWTPGDDALRHVAKVISGKEWRDILVIRPEFTMDSHPGWHFILKQVEALTGPNGLLLLDFSVLFFFLLFVFPPLFFFKRPEAWIGSLLIFWIFGGGVRFLYGRPFIFNFFLVVVFCFLWERIRDRRAPITELAAFTIICALNTWITTTWYLLALPICSLGLSRQWRVSFLMTLSAAVGIILGASFTGSPLIFMQQMTYHGLQVVGHYDFQTQLVSELQPFDGAPFAVIVIAAMLIWRAARGEWRRECVDNPVFILAALGWIFGFFVVRFWSDWGWPAIAFWTAQEIESVIKKRTDDFNPCRLLICTVLCLTLFLAVTNDRGRRWTAQLGVKWPEMANAEQREWLPDPVGILYNDSMDVFYRIFYNNPHGDWRYILGFESAWMPEEDLKIYRHIQLTGSKPESYAPWITKMTAKDRLILLRTEKPKVEGLEWHEVTPTVWSGKKAVHGEE